jgi:hypothetical protein
MRRPLAVAILLLSAACASHKPVPPAPGREGLVTPPAPTPKANEVAREFDLNHDGRTDLWTYSVTGADGKETVVRKEKDLNGDGKIDVWEVYGADGALAKVTYDLDFDGKADVTLFFEKDQLVRKEYAFGFDGVAHAFNYYEKGKLVRKERDANGDGKIDYWEYWENGEIDRIGVDTDGDGQVDRWESRRTAQAAEQKPAEQKK